MPADQLRAVLARSPQIAIYSPNTRAHPFGAALQTFLKDHGFAAYEIDIGAHPRDMWHAARTTQPDTGVVFLEYAPGDYQLAGVLVGLIRWRARGNFVVLLREAGSFRSPRQRLAFALVSAFAGLTLAAGADPASLFASWPRGRFPSRSALAKSWVVRTNAPQVNEIVPLLRCPSCAGDLRRSAEGLACEGCRRMHPIVDGIPILLPEGAHAQVDEHDHGYEPGDAYDVGGEGHRAWLEIGLYKRDLVAKLVRGRMPRASLDVGCGDWGLHHDVVAAIGREVAISGDVSLKLVSFARSHASAPNRVHHLVFSADALPFRDRAFDFTYCSEVLEHLDHPERALAEMARTGAGGRAIFTVPNELITGKLEAGHVQTFGYDSFLALIAPHVQVQRTLGVFRWATGGPEETLARRPLGWLRFALQLKQGERSPRRSLSILTDGILRP